MSVLSKVKINGVDFPIGDKGVPGMSPTIDVTDIEGGCRLTINDINGTKTVDLVTGGTGLASVWFLTEFNGFTAIRGMSIRENSLVGIDTARTWTVIDPTGATVGTFNSSTAFALSGLDKTKVYTVRSDFAHTAKLKFAAEGSMKGLVATVPVGCNTVNNNKSPQIYELGDISDESFFVLSGYASTGSHQVISAVVPVALLRLGYSGYITEHVSIKSGGIIVESAMVLNCTFYLVRT